MKLKNKKVLSIVAILLGVVIIIFFFFASKKDKEIDYVMRVGNLKVAREEVNIILSEIKLKNKNNLINTYQIKDGEFDWNKSYGNKIAYEYLVDDMMEQMHRIKTIQQLAIEEGLLDKFDYQVFIKMWKDENKERADKIANGEIVYGLNEFSENQYYDYFNNNLMLNLKNVLIDSNKISVSKDEEIQVYENNKSYFNDLNYEEVASSVKNLCYEKKVVLYIEEKMREVELDYNDEDLKRVVKEMID